MTQYIKFGSISRERLSICLTISGALRKCGLIRVLDAYADVVPHRGENQSSYRHLRNILEVTLIPSSDD